MSTGLAIIRAGVMGVDQVGSVAEDLPAAALQVIYDPGSDRARDG